MFLEGEPCLEKLKTVLIGKVGTVSLEFELGRIAKVTCVLFGNYLLFEAEDSHMEVGATNVIRSLTASGVEFPIDLVPEAILGSLPGCKMVLGEVKSWCSSSENFWNLDWSDPVLNWILV